MRWVCPSPPRFRSQVFSTSQRFPSLGPMIVALFRATAVPGILPSELFPYKDRAPLSRPLAPLQLSTDVLKRVVPGRSPPVSPTSTLSRSCLDPRTTMDSLSTSRSSLPGHPGLSTAESLRSASFTYFEALFPLQDRSSGSGSPLGRRPLLSWLLFPFEAFPSTPRILDPPRPRSEHAPSSEDSGARLEGPQPLEPGETLLSTSCTQEDLVDGFQTP